jgi:hypothetical protein
VTDHHDRRTDTAAEDEAFLAGARRLGAVLRHPFAMGILAIAAVALLFGLGISIGESIYVAFDGERMMAAAFGAALVTILVALIAIGVWLDRRQRTRDTQAAPLSDEQRERLHAYLDPASALVRWHQPISIGLFVALAAPGTWLLDSPWDGLWVIALLVVNPLGGVAVAVLLWADALETTLAVTLTGIAVVAVIVGGGLVTSHHERRHITGLLHDERG